jgi:hypothetical protein
MARDFFIAPRIGIGTKDDPFRPKVPGTITSFNTACGATHCLVLVTGDTSAAQGDASLTTLVTNNLDQPPSSLPVATRNRIQNGLTNASIPLTLMSFETVKAFLQALGEWFEGPTFNLDVFMRITGN